MGEPTFVIDGDMLHDVVVCERRAWQDLHASADLRDPIHAVAELLWRDGVANERDVLDAFAGRGDAIDLRGEPPEARPLLTAKALADPDALYILGAELAWDGKVGRPDLLTRGEDGRWLAGIVRAGGPLSAERRSVSRSHGVQIGLAAHILMLAGHGDGGRGFVVGPNGETVVLDLDRAWGASTLRAITLTVVERARQIGEGIALTRGAWEPHCGLCRWRSLCRRELEAADDLTLIPGLGRRERRDVELLAPNRRALADLDVDALALRGAGPTVHDPELETLARFRDRARLQLTPGAGGYALERLAPKRAPLEWHLAVDADPSRDGLVYLHGVWERRLGADGAVTTRFVHFWAADAAREGRAFGQAWRFLTRSRHALIHCWTPGARLAYLLLARAYPDVCSEADVETLFGSARVVDLHADVIEPSTEWPLADYDLPGVAMSLGFEWPADLADAALSLSLFDEHVRTRDALLKAGIVGLGRTRCMAMAAILDGLARLPVGAPAWPPAPGSVADAASERAGRRRVAGKGGAAPRLRRVPSDDAALLATIETVGAKGSADRARLYDVPTMRVSAAATDDWRRDDHRAAFASLTKPLPLAGAAAFAPTADDGFALVERLRARAPWMEGAIGVVERSLRIGSWTGRPWLALPPLLLVGGPGAGKSFFARLLAEAAEVPCSATDLGAASDALGFAGVARGWSSAIPCWPAREIVAHGVANPVLIGDELEKSGGHRRSGGGMVHDAVLNMIEPGTSKAYADRCLLADIDLSAVVWVFTANELDGIPAPLLSRLEVVRVEGPGPDHFDALVGAIEAELVARWGLPPDAMRPLPPSVMAELRRMFARRRSARELGWALRRLHEAAVPPRPDVLH